MKPPKLIVRSHVQLTVGKVVTGVNSVGDHGKTVAMAIQPILILRETTYAEWAECWKDHGELAPDNGDYYYEIHTD